MVFFNLNIVEIDNFLDNIYFRFQLFELKIGMHDHWDSLNVCTSGSNAWNQA